MSRYFFDLHIDDSVHRDDTGMMFDTLEDVRHAAQKLLPAVGYEELPQDGDRRSLLVLVRDESTRPIYMATLSFAGLWLNR